MSDPAVKKALTQFLAKALHDASVKAVVPFEPVDVRVKAVDDLNVMVTVKFVNQPTRFFNVKVSESS